MDDIGVDDFLLVLQTQFQLDMLKAKGHKCIYKDTTYGVNIYNFMLISVLVERAYQLLGPLLIMRYSTINTIHESNKM